MHRIRRVSAIITAVAAIIAIQGAVASAAGDGYEGIDMKGIRERLDKFAPFELRYDASRLTDGEQKAIRELVRAGDLVDRIFLEQMGPGTAQIFESLRRAYEEHPSDDTRALLEYFWLNKSPYDESNDDAPEAPFVTGPGIAPQLVKTRGFYPAGATPEILEAWMQSLPEDKRQLARSDFSIVRGTVKDGRPVDFQAVPYSTAYALLIPPLAAALKMAAAEVPGTTLERFLNARVIGLMTNDYEESEAIWIDMNGQDDPAGGNLDVTVGPYENYLDELLKRKASFQFYLTVLRPEKTQAMQLFREHVHAMDDYLFERFRATYGDEGLVRWAPPGADVTLVAVDVAYATGMGNRGYQTLGYNLPNVAEWTEKYGTKKVMLMNVLDGKFHKILRPIADMVLAAKDREDVVADMFTDNTVRHEVAHGIGPSTIFVPVAEGDAPAASTVSTTDAAGRQILARKVDVRDRLQRYYSAFEEAKAEVVSLVFGYWLQDRGLVDAAYTRRMATTYVASTFRTVRFGAASDHAKGKLFEWNRLVGYGAIRRDGDTFRIDHDRFRAAAERLAMDILAVQMFGTVETAGYLLRADGCLRPDMQAALARIAATDIPIDLRVRFTVGQNWTVIDPIAAR